MTGTHTDPAAPIGGRIDMNLTLAAHKVTFMSIPPAQVREDRPVGEVAR